MQITYQKKDGSIIKRYRKTMLPYEIGNETSMGWKVLNVEYEYNGNYYPKYKYSIIINKIKKASVKKKKRKETYIKELKSFVYCFVSSILIISILKFILGI